MEKILITNESVLLKTQEMFKENTKTITIQKGDEIKQVDLYTDLNPYFFCFQKDTTPTGFYGLSEETQSDYIEQITNQLQQTMVLVEVSNIDMISSPDIDGGNFTATLTFFIPTDKVANLDYYITYLRNVYQGKYDKWGDDSEAILIAKIGELQVNDNPFNSPIGRTNICTLEISFGYLDNCTNYTEESEKIQVSEDNVNYVVMPISQASVSVVMTTMQNTRIDNPKAIGDISTSSTIGITLSYYELSKFPLFATISDKLLGVCSLESSNYDLNNYLYVKFRNHTFKMVVKSYTANITNTDFTSVALSLSCSV